MKKEIIGLMSTLFCLSGAASFAAHDNNLCIALTNYTSFAVEFDSIVSPGSSYTVQPKQTAILSGDHMVGACIRVNGLCAVSISGGGEWVIIDGLPRGTHIIYGGAKDYYLDKNANVPCVS